MSFFDAMNVSATGLTAQRLRMDTISENIANVDTTRTTDGTPYKRKTVLFEAMDNTPASFASVFNKAVNGGGASDVGGGVRVTQIATDNSPGQMVYDPSNPDANADGYVEMPNVNIVEEMANMISASRSYEANITAINNTKAMLSKTLEIGRS